MRCEECGRVMHNAEMWQLAGDRNAPSARSLKNLCRNCRQASSPLAARLAHKVLEQANEVVRQHSRPR
jgi:hypothetical protein